MRRETRIKILNKLAKKDKLSGKKSRKDVEKILAKAKQSHDKATSEIKSVEKMIASLEDKHSKLKDELAEAKSDMKRCHTALRGMDFSGAVDAKFTEDKVLYPFGNKLHEFDDEDNLVLYVKNKPAEEELEVPEAESEEETEEGNPEEVFAADDVNYFVGLEEGDEGVDLFREEV